MKNKTIKDNSAPFRERLYSAFLFINNLYDLEDLLYLKSREFLKLCGVQAIDWSFSALWLKTDSLIKKEPNLWPFQYTSPLHFKSENYGELHFYSSQKISQRKKQFLKKVSSFTASTLFSIENKKKLFHIKKQWVNTFDIFYQAFCITDKDFNIIHFNQAFQQLFQKKDSSCKNLFKNFPFLIKKSEILEKEGSFLAQGDTDNKKTYWEISFKTLYLRQENSKAILFLIKNITEEMKIKSQLSNQTKERELGLIKGSLAHELNNPIAGIKALLAVIEKELSQDQYSVKSTLKDMQKSVDTCHQVVQNLLLASKKQPTGF